MGCGKIASDFANSVKLLPKGDHEIVAVAAGDLARAKEFAKKFGVKHAFGSYEELAAHPDIEIVYINTLHISHLHCAKLALNAGKHVLCEKSMAVNLKQVREMIQLARQKGLFLMEGYWSRFFPVYEEVRKALKNEEIGEPKFVQGNFGHQVDPAELARVLKKSLGGSSLMDFGCYLVMFSTMIFNGQRPESVHAIGKLNEDGVDIMDCITLKYKNDAVAQLMMSAEVAMAQRVLVMGTKGQLEVPRIFNSATKVIINSKEITHPLPECKEQLHYPNQHGLLYEIQCVRDCLLKGHKECPLMTLEHSEVIMEIMDEIRRQVGVVYPEDKQ